MSSEANRPAPSHRLRLAIVLDTTKEACGVFAAGQRVEVRYMPAFPRPRVERVAPGNLAAIATAAAGSEVVVWRWFDAVVLVKWVASSASGNPPTASCAHSPVTFRAIVDQGAGCTSQPGCRVPTGGSPVLS